MKIERQPLDLLKQIADASNEAAKKRTTNKDLKTDWSGIGFSYSSWLMIILFNNNNVDCFLFVKALDMS